MSGNPFDDLAEDVAGTPEEDGEAAASDGAAEPDPDAGSDAATPAESVGTGAERTDAPGSGEADGGPARGSLAGSEGPTLTSSSPPFPYSETEQQQMYVRAGLWDEFEDLGFDAELELRRTFGVRNVEQRELDTALVRLALERFTPREVAETVVRTRGFDPADAE